MDRQVRALGGRVMDYLPDFSYLVWMDGAAQKQVAALDAVRWVGLYQPAYKLSPNLDRTKPIYRVVLFEGADLGAVSARLAGLNTPTRQVAGEQFALLLPEGGVDEVANWPEVLWIENRPLYRTVQRRGDRHHGRDHGLGQWLHRLRPDGHRRRHRHRHWRR